MAITFEWNEAKDEKNLGKHGVSFREAMSVSAIHYR